MSGLGASLRHTIVVCVCVLVPRVVAFAPALPVCPLEQENYLKMTPTERREPSPSFDCAVCFSTVGLSAIVILDCSHRFCQGCLQVRVFIEVSLTVHGARMQLRCEPPLGVAQSSHRVATRWGCGAFPVPDPLPPHHPPPASPHSPPLALPLVVPLSLLLPPEPCHGGDGGQPCTGAGLPRLPAKTYRGGDQAYPGAHHVRSVRAVQRPAAAGAPGPGQGPGAVPQAGVLLPWCVCASAAAGFIALLRVGQALRCTCRPPAHTPALRSGPRTVSFPVYWRWRVRENWTWGVPLAVCACVPTAPPPRPNGAVIKHESTKMVVCQNPACKFTYCASCQVEWHSDATCEAYQKWKVENAGAADAYVEVRSLCMPSPHPGGFVPCPVRPPSTWRGTLPAGTCVAGRGGSASVQCPVPLPLPAHPLWPCQWTRRNTKPCPKEGGGCGVPIEKNGGCNHMT